MQDKNKDPGATDKFKEISEAYDVSRIRLEHISDGGNKFLLALERMWHRYMSQETAWPGSGLGENRQTVPRYMQHCRSYLIPRSERSMINLERKD